MRNNYDANLNMDVITIFPGEFYATNKDEVITTLLGSCVSVVLIDPVNRVSGMNHFVLPGNSAYKPVLSRENGQYGVFAMTLLIERMITLGACRNNLQAKIFGGGSVLPKYSDYTESVPANNIKFALKYLRKKNISIVSSDIGGLEGRKIFFVTEKQAVFVKKIITPAVGRIP